MQPRAAAAAGCISFPHMVDPARARRWVVVVVWRWCRAFSPNRSIVANKLQGQEAVASLDLAGRQLAEPGPSLAGWLAVDRRPSAAAGMLLELQLLGRYSRRRRSPSAPADNAKRRRDVKPGGRRASGTSSTIGRANAASQENGRAPRKASANCGRAVVLGRRASAVRSLRAQTHVVAVFC